MAASGLVRRLIFDPVTGMSRLETERISRASAEQRQGRAGRVARGVCYRAWSAQAQKSLAPFTAAEILTADLAPLALDLALWGARAAGGDGGAGRERRMSRRRLRGMIDRYLKERP